MIAAEDDAAAARAELAPLAAEVAECRVRAVSSNSPPLPLCRYQQRCRPQLLRWVPWRAAGGRRGGEAG